MKFTIFILLSAVAHYIGLFMQPVSPKAMTFSQGQKADRVAINIINSTQVNASKVAKKIPAEPKLTAPAVKNDNVSTEFSGTKQHLKVVKKTSENIKKIIDNPPKKPAKAKPVNTAKNTEHKKSVKNAPANKNKIRPAAPSSSTTKLSNQHSATNQLVTVTELPLFKAPKPMLTYPLRAKKRGYEGVTLLQIELNKQGHIAKLTVLKSSGFTELDKAALNNVAQWQFHPVVKNNHPIKARFSVPIRFSLNV